MSVSVGDWGVGSQGNKFEQVPSDDHQMSLAGGKGSSEQPTSLMSRGEVEGGTPGLISGALPYHVTYLMMHVMLLRGPPPPPVKTLPSLSFCCDRSVST